MVTPNFLFGYQEYLLRSTFSGQFQTAQKYPCISKHWRQEIQVSGDAQNVCAITIVGTVLTLRTRVTNIAKIARINNKSNKIQDLGKEEVKKGLEMSANAAKIAKVTRIFLPCESSPYKHPKNNMSRRFATLEKKKPKGTPKCPQIPQK